MTISISHVHIIVDDPDAALGFYRDILGLEVFDEAEYEGNKWVNMRSQSQPDIQIVLSQPHAGRSQEDGDAIAALLAKGELGPVFFSSTDLDATFEKMVAAIDVEILEEPADQFWGARDCAVRDPAGNMIRIQQA